MYMVGFYRHSGRKGQLIVTRHDLSNPPPPPLLVSSACFWQIVFIQLWHVVHDDGDEEDMEEHEIEKALKYFDEGIDDQPESDKEVRIYGSIYVFFLVPS